MYAEHFAIENIPFGVASSATHPHKSVATRVGDTVFYLDELAKAGLLKEIQDSTLKTFSFVRNPSEIQSLKKKKEKEVEETDILYQETVNTFAALSKSDQRITRGALQRLLSNSLDKLPSNTYSAISATTLHLPLSIGDFTDFSCSRDHNLNASEAIFGKRVLPDSFEYFPGGYTARSSSIVISGTKIRRPKGQYKDKEKIVYGATRRLDYELEVACVIGKSNGLGKSIDIEDADDHIFGVVLLNDWSGK